MFSSVPPNVKNQEEATILCGSKASVDFVLTGVPPPRVTVHRDNHIVSENERLQLIFGKEQFTLVLNSVVLEDEGTYKITAENKAGQATSEIKLITQGNFTANDVPDSLAGKQALLSHFGCTPTSC